MRTSTLLGFGLTALAFMMLCTAIAFGFPGGLLVPALVVVGSLWIGIPQARSWWQHRAVAREMRSDLRELLNSNPERRQS